jgi:hypothetical protein
MCPPFGVPNRPTSCMIRAKGLGDRRLAGAPGGTSATPSPSPSVTRAHLKLGVESEIRSPLLQSLGLKFSLGSCDDGVHWSPP